MASAIGRTVYAQNAKVKFRLKFATRLFDIFAKSTNLQGLQICQNTSVENFVNLEPSIYVLIQPEA
jgi:hypothetical protein